MLDIWSWMNELPNSYQWGDFQSLLIYELASSKSSKDGSTQSIQLVAERTSGSDSEALVTFSLRLQGFHPFNAPKTLWVSDTCPLSSDKPFLPLLLQLLQEIVKRSPTTHNSTCPRSQLQNLKPDPIVWLMDSHSPESFSAFFNLVFLTRLFWLCVCDAPSEAGSIYFDLLLADNIESLTCKHAPVLRTFLVTVGVDAELCFMRSLGYLLAKWLILRETSVGLRMLTPAATSLCSSYAVEANGLWILKGYAPILAMKTTRSSGPKTPIPLMEANESVLRYALAHQQLEAVIQLEYSIKFHDSFIQVDTRVNNLRFHVVKLGFNKNDDMDYGEEKHFLSRIRIWVGPEVGSTYVGSLTLGRSTDNKEKEVSTQKIVKGILGKSKVTSKTKLTAKMSTRTKMRNWRWDQDAEGNAAVYEAVLCDNGTGDEVAAWKMDGGASMKKRYSGEGRAFTKSGGVVFAEDEYGEEVRWRLSREMEGSVLKWRIGGHVWLSYWPNEVKSSYYETRCVEWCDEVDLPLIRVR